MIFINEWFPNPPGKDDPVEFVELFNSAKVPAALDGYFLTAGGKKKFSLSGRTIPPEGYLVFTKAQTKLALKNASGGLWLYGPGGELADKGVFAGPAQIGKSFARVSYDRFAAGVHPQEFAWSYPTPGAKNPVANVAVTVRDYPTGVSLATHLTPGDFLGILVGTAAFIAGIFIYVIQKNEDLQKFFFGRNEEIR